MQEKSAKYPNFVDKLAILLITFALKPLI